jgi:hypothetical protein
VDAARTLVQSIEAIDSRRNEMKARTSNETKWPTRWLVSLAVILSLPQSAAAAESESTARSRHREEALFAFDSPIGLIEYASARGLWLGKTGLNIGGFATFEIEKERHEDGEFAIDGINFLILFEPVPCLRGFMEIEVGDLLAVNMNNGRTASNPSSNFQRLYGDLTLDDAFNVRLGKFQTPVGRWNLAPAEPFTWTATDPIIIEAFDEHQTGAMAFGSFFPGDNPLSYWIYAQFTDPFDPESDEEPADRSVGGRLEYGSSFGSWSLGASFLASQYQERWGYLGGLDAGWWHDRFELTSEFVYTAGDLQNPIGWDINLEGVVEVLPSLYLVGRYEHTDPTEQPRALNLGGLGVTWLPRRYLNFKATYRWADHSAEDVFEGFKASFSVIF